MAGMTMMTMLLHACPAHLGLGASCNTLAMAGMGMCESALEEHLEYCIQPTV
jgi:hypothetical protein